jgi:hypothetical protein
MDLSSEQAAELRALAISRDVPAVVAMRARIVLWSAEWSRLRKDIAELAGVSLLTVDRWKDRYAELGLAGPASAVLLALESTSATAHGADRRRGWLDEGCRHAAIVAARLVLLAPRVRADPDMGRRDVRNGYVGV